MAGAQRLINRRRWLPRACLPLAGGAAAPGCLPLHDAFTDTNGVDLVDHTIAPQNPGNLSWVNIAAPDYPAKINSNNAMAGDDGACYYLVDPQKADCNISFKICHVGDLWLSYGLIARFTDSSHYWKIVSSAQEDAFILYEVNGGVAKRASKAVSIDHGVFYPVVVTLNGAVINATFNGGNAISYNSAEFNKTATKHGIFLIYPGDRADDFKIEALP